MAWQGPVPTEVSSEIAKLEYGGFRDMWNDYLSPWTLRETEKKVLEKYAKVPQATREDFIMRKMKPFLSYVIDTIEAEINLEDAFRDGIVAVAPPYSGEETLLEDARRRYDILEAKREELDKAWMGTGFNWPLRRKLQEERFRVEVEMVRIMMDPANHEKLGFDEPNEEADKQREEALEYLQGVLEDYPDIEPI